ncbi:L,D-transpeptidase [Streptomyces lasiicapitis]|uniref:L,D-transpeptidase n=1 Tax=Streptomyces lasiicapitis TaxID=1923961 RepID=UPI00166B2C54|nr:L,D-transpeptidase [Streptomyces lasiicapitis]
MTRKTRRAGTRHAVRGAVAAALCAAVLVGCGGGSEEGGRGPSAESEDRKPVDAGTPTPRAKPVVEPAALRGGGVRVNVHDGQRVGVGMPVSVTFARPVPAAQRAAVERRLTVRTTTPNTTPGSWSWVKDRNLHDGRRVDYRPKTYWKPGSEVTVRVGSGTVRRFTVARSLVATVDVRTHTMTVVKDGATRRVPVTAGAPGMDTWNGTMVVSDKQRRVRMDSRTVGYGDAYNDDYNYAVHLTTSGTYLHENPKANTYAGTQNVTHGCIGLATDGTARRFFEEVIPGDVVRVTGSKETVAPGNGYGDWNVPWEEWRAGSALRK